MPVTTGVKNMDVAVACPCHGKLGLCWHQSMQLCGGQWDYIELHQPKPWPILSPRFVSSLPLCNGLPTHVSIALKRPFLLNAFIYSLQMAMSL